MGFLKINLLCLNWLLSLIFWSTDCSIFDQMETLNAGFGALWWWPFCLIILSFKVPLILSWKTILNFRNVGLQIFHEVSSFQVHMEIEVTVNRMLSRCPSRFLVVTHLHISNKCINIFQSFFFYVFNVYSANIYWMLNIFNALFYFLNK